jgi:hypothetical protein
MPTKEMNAMLSDSRARKIIQGDYMPQTREELNSVLLSTPQRQAYQIRLARNHRNAAEEEEQ